MIDFLFWLVGAPAWLVGGAYTSKQAIAMAERHYLRLAYEAWEKDQRNQPQDKMDTDDWIGASVFAGAAFVAFPAIAAGWILGKLLSPFFGPTRKFFLPPVQKEFEEHVQRMDNQKALMVATAKTYEDVLGWEPKDHPDRVAMIHQLQEQITQQMEDLMKMSNPNRPSGFDTAYLDRAKMEVKELTAGGA